MPNTFCYSRTVLIEAPAEAIAPAIVDLRRHADWSPFATPDPKISDAIEGEAGVGQRRTFSGGRTGTGELTVDAVLPDRIAMTLTMTKPLKATNIVEYILQREGTGTRVTWLMRGPTTLVGRIMGLFIDCDAMCGRMFEQGLASLKSLSEARMAHRLAA